MIKLPLFILIFFSAFFGLCKEKTEFIFAICFCLALIERAEVFFINVLVNSVFRQEFLSMIGLDNSNKRIENEILMCSNVINSRRKATFQEDIGYQQKTSSSRLLIKQDEFNL